MIGKCSVKLRSIHSRQGAEPFLPQLRHFHLLQPLRLMRSGVLVRGGRLPSVPPSLCLVTVAVLQSSLYPFECRELLSVLNPCHNLGPWESGGTRLGWDSCCIYDHRTLVSLLSALAPLLWVWPDIRMSPSTVHLTKPFTTNTSRKGSCSQPRS